MPPLDPSIILGIRPAQVADPTEQIGRALTVANAANAYQEDQTYKQAAQQSGGDLTKLRDLLYAGGAPKQALAVEQARLKAQTETETLKKTQLENHAASAKAYRDYLSTLGPDNYNPDAVRAKAIESFGPQAGGQFQIPTAYDQKWQQQQEMTAEKHLDLVKSHMTPVNTGATTQLVETNPNAPGFKNTPIAHTATPGELMADKTKREIAGIGADGLPTGDVKDVAKAIAEYRMAPLTSMALSRPRGQQIMAEVMTQNPDYDVTDANVKFKAAKDFATGKQGNSVRSFNVALTHLDTLDRLADALNNKDTQAINKIGNFFASQTGSPAPTNFEAAKKIVGDEIVKAIVGSGGGVTDREEAAKTIAAANSPAQLKGVIGTYKELMRGQLGGLRQQYETTTGRKDFDKYLSEEAKVQAHMPAAAAKPEKAAPQSFDSLPDPAKFDGKTMTDTTTNTKYKSQGGKWVRL